MIPITLKVENVFHWALFGLRELFRVLWDRLLRRGPREQQVAEVVEREAKLGNPASVLETIDRFAARRFLMNVGREKGSILEEALDTAGAKRVLELGCYCGYSAVRVGRLLQAQGGRLVSIEKSPDFARWARRVVDHAGLSDTVEIRVGAAEERIPTLKGTFDVVFIDHWKDAYLPDLQALEARGLLADGAVVVADNVGIFERTLAPYLDHVRHSGKYRSEHHVTHMEYSDTIRDGVEVSVRLPSAA